MTTKEAEQAYLAHHLATYSGGEVTVFNPHGKPIEDLPAIYGFNNGGSPGWYNGVLLAEDGSCLGGHACSHEGYMPHDLGVHAGSRPDRHEGFQKHYPDGYRMVFVGEEEVRAKAHAGLQAAINLNLAAQQEEVEREQQK